MMHISSPKTALEALMHVFYAQLKGGYKNISFTMKHQDGSNQFIRGNVETVLRGDMVLDIEYHDLIIFEHSDQVREGIISWCDPNIPLNTLITLCADKDEYAMATISRYGPFVFFVFKNSPMARYMLLGNEIISNMVPSGASKGSIMNNMCGKLICEKGLSHIITF